MNPCDAIFLLEKHYSLIKLKAVCKYCPLTSYGTGGFISLTLNHLISTLFASSQRNVAIGPPHVIIWSEDPPHAAPSFPQPPESMFSYTLTKSLSLSGSSQVSIFTAVLPSFWKLYITNLNPIHFPVSDSVTDFSSVDVVSG